jgi:hypothetical protein
MRCHLTGERQLGFCLESCFGFDLEGPLPQKLISIQCIGGIMATKVAKVGVKRQKDYLYFLDKKGNVSRVKMARGGKSRGKTELVEKVGVKRKEGFLYFIDKQGDVSCAKLSRGGKAKRKAKARRKKR